METEPMHTLTWHISRFDGSAQGIFGSLWATKPLIANSSDELNSTRPSPQNPFLPFVCSFETKKKLDDVDENGEKKKDERKR
uniref:Uncharacterized protein n=1 Tax=Caenorhabditis japonica TaxID=281687 RepID=A0A8R1ED93_CAEJA